jgi:F0F1-type ATP synthase assembly protein I
LNGFASRIRPFRIVLRWQLIATAVLTLVSAIPWGGDGALSAALGGALNMVAGGVYGWRVTRGEARTAGEALVTMFRAWGIKVLLIVAQLVLVLSLYRDIVHAAFFAAFVVTVAVFAAAVAVSEPGQNKIHH